MPMTPRTRATLRTAAIAVIASMTTAVGFGRSASHRELTQWWDEGAGLSSSSLRAQIPAFYGDDAVSQFFAQLTIWFAEPGKAIWNALTGSMIGRWMLLGVIGAIVIDSAKAGILWLIRKPTPEKPMG